MAQVQLVLESNTRAHLVGEFCDKKLDLAFSVLVNKQFFRSAAYKHGYDGRKHYYLRTTKSFPAGLWRDVRKFLRAQGHTVVRQDKRKGRLRPGAVPTTLGGDITLRDYQLEALGKAVRRGRGILHVATGGGKTELMAALVEAYGRPVTVILTSKATLVQQTRERLAWRLGLDPYDLGVISQGTWQEGEVPIYVALVTTWMQDKHAKRRKVLAEDCRLLLIDEGHHAGAASWYKAAQGIKAYHRFGLTGTPTGRSDGKDIALRAVTGGVVAKVSAHRLVKAGILAKPHVFFTDVHGPKLDLTAKTYTDAYTHGIVRHAARNDLVVDYARQLTALGRKTWIFVRRIEHGKALAQQLPHSAFLCAAHASVFQQRAVVERFVKGKLDTLILTNIFDEGVDTPAVDAIILAAGGKSAIETLQRVGRGMRRKQDNRLFVFDFWDHCHMYLGRHSQARQETCQKARYDVVCWDAPQPLAEHAGAVAGQLPPR